MKDYIIVGFGFAGIAFAHLLEKHQKSFIVFDGNIPKSTQTAAALYNPVVLKRFTSVWKASEQMNLLHNFYQEIQEKLGEIIYEKLPTFRKFISLEEQNNWFIASDKPTLDKYLSIDIKKEINKNIETPFGVGEVLETGRIDTRKMEKLYQKHLQEKECFQRENFDFSQLQIVENGVFYKGISAKRIVFCEGYNVVQNPFFTYLPMQGCKGELLTIFSSELNLDSVIKSGVFIIPFGNDTYKVGTTYVLDDKTYTPTIQAKEELLQKLKELIHSDFEIIGQEAGIRPTTLDRRPLVGIHPENPSLCILNGLGTRGAMLAPYTATALFHHLENGVDLDKEMNINRFYKRFFVERNFAKK